MYKTGSQLKREARQALAGKWGIAVLMTVITSLIATTLSVPVSENVTISFGSLIGTLLSVIFSVGFYSFLLKICCGQKDQAGFKDIIYGFQCHPGKALLLYLLSVLYLLPGTLIYVIAILVFSFTTIASTGLDMTTALLLESQLYIAPGTAVIYLVVILVMTVAYIVYACYISLTYSMVYFLLLDYPDLPATEIWKRSKQLMKGNRLRLFGLELSFIGWMILCVFTLGIGVFWLNPYMLATETEFYLDLIQHQSMRNQASAAPNQAASYADNAVYKEHASYMEDAPRTDCTEEHTDHRETDGNNYSGINQDTFK